MKRAFWLIGILIFLAAGPGGKAKGLYEKICGSCHGNTGMSDGPAGKALKPLPTLLADWQTMERFSDAYLRQVIMKGKMSTFTKPEGFENNEMPSFKKEGLSTEQIKSLVNYVRAIQKEKPPATEEGMKKFNEKYSDEMALYQKHCERCHGKFADGNGPDMEKAKKEKKDLQPIPPDFRNELFMNRFSDDHLAKIISEGRKAVTVGGKVAPMAGFGSQIGEQNIDALIAYIRSLSEANKKATLEKAKKEAAQKK